jgi:hypothetical protein
MGPGRDRARQLGEEDDRQMTTTLPSHKRSAQDALGPAIGGAPGLARNHLPLQHPHAKFSRISGYALP